MLNQPQKCYVTCKFTLCDFEHRQFKKHFDCLILTGFGQSD